MRPTPAPPQRTHPAPRGLSLLELLITLAVLAITVTYGVPEFREFIANNRQTAAVNRFVMTVLHARSLALTHQVHAVICPTSDGQTCEESTDWTRGWLLLTHPVETTDRPSAATHKLVRYEATTQPVNLRVNRTLLRFRPRGKRATNGTAVFCTAHATRPRAAIVSYNGRPRTASVLANGGAIECG